MSKRFRQLNNDGMTLVELLVALVILAAIVVPLLHTFISAANVNKTARAKLRVTTVAQDIMEGIKADTLEDLAYQFNWPNGYDDGTVKNDSFHLINKDLVGGNNANINEVRCSGITAKGGVSNLELASTLGDISVSMDAIGKNYELINRTDGKYYFALQNVAVQATGANQYTDAIIAVDSTKYRDGGGISSNQAKLNAMKTVDITDMNPKNNSIFSEDSNLEVSSLQQINILNSTSYTVADLSKEITVLVTKASDIVKVNVEYKFKAGGYSHTESYPCFDNTGNTDNDLTGVYLFYYPNYSGASDDVINIVNNDCVDFTLYLVKQQKAGSDATLNSDENGYHCTVNVKESGIPVSNKHIKLRTNLDYNLFALYNSTGIPGLMSPGQTSFYYNTGAINRDNLKVESLGGERVDDRLYDVKVYLYEAGSIADALGGGSIPEDKLLISLDGSMK